MIELSTFHAFHKHVACTGIRLFLILLMISIQVMYVTYASYFFSFCLSAVYARESLQGYFLCK